MKTTGVSGIPKFGLLVFLGHPNFHIILTLPLAHASLTLNPSGHLLYVGQACEEVQLLLSLWLSQEAILRVQSIFYCTDSVCGLVLKSSKKSCIRQKVLLILKETSLFIFSSK